MNQNKDFVEVYHARGEAEAQIIVALLESNDIPSFLAYEAAYSASVLVVNTVSRVKVMVRPQDAKAALGLINNTGKTQSADNENTN